MKDTVKIYWNGYHVEAYMDKNRSRVLWCLLIHESANSFLNNNKFKHFLQNNHIEESSKNDVQSHYDLEMTSINCRLDKTCNIHIPCAYFEKPDGSLEEAQNKVHHILKKLDPNQVLVY